MHLISQLLQITSAWWLASMFPLWMQIKLSHTVLKPHFNGRTSLHQDRTGCPLSLQFCDAGTLLLLKKEENKLFSLGLDCSATVPYFREIFLVLKTFLLLWQVYVLWTGWDAPSLLGRNEGKWRDVVPPSSPALGKGLEDTLGCTAFSLPLVSLLLGCSHLWWGGWETKCSSFVFWCFRATLFLQRCRTSSGSIARSSAGTEPTGMETDDRFCKR